LQAAPNRDYADFRRSQDELLNTYGWVDRERGVARIPVSRAMELMLDRGLPSPSPTTDSTSQP
jgi:hypothetical protein